AEGRTFTSGSLWSRQGDDLDHVASIGATPGMDVRAAAGRAFLQRAFTSSTAVVGQISIGDQPGIAYALADEESGYVVYAERPIPADRRAPVDRDSAFAELHYAIYLGDKTTDANLSTTDLDPAELPLTGVTHRTAVPFGDTVLTL